MIKAQKGTKDIILDESAKWQAVEKIARDIFAAANYKEIRTPIFESTELFTRGVGDSTDIVNKEMYSFKQKDRDITLRPENTAGVVRAFIEHNMQRLSPPVKLWYTGPMFRYERPQAGRQRQFHQAGVELFGIKEAAADAEAILTAIEFLHKLGLKDLELEINSLGCPKCRENFTTELKKEIFKNLDKFCDDCKVRYEKNPLRMLDCKSEECQTLLKTENIRKIITGDFICEECQAHFEELKSYLNTMDIKYSVNKLLVRGLDYYNRTVFEIKSNNLGSQNAVCGGGRYDNLVEMLGGTPTPAVGWAMGMERLLSLVEQDTSQVINAFVVSNNTAETLKLVQNLRAKGLCVEFDMQNRKFSKQLEKAVKSGAQYALILGEDEISSNKITVKNLETTQQQTVSSAEALGILTK
ncbi:MAG: histidine--tRNA ligase [Candidatus Gastranaerophilales bacterium]|nr:histidine--tRNA ligase [Candidatus Gastranaerophilales bacterium]